MTGGCSGDNPLCHPEALFAEGSGFDPRTKTKGEMLHFVQDDKCRHGEILHFVQDDKKGVQDDKPTLSS